MKMLMLPNYPIRCASSRYRVFQYKSYLENAGIKCNIKPPVSDRVFDVFYPFLVYNVSSNINSALKIFPKSIFKILIFFNRLLMILNEAQSYDIIFVHRAELLAKTGLISKLLTKYNKNIVYDFDDALFALKGLEKGIIEILKSAKIVIAGNSYLANFASNYNTNVFVIPTSVDLAYYKPCNRRTSSEVIIGWTGNPGNLRHIKHIKSSLERVMRLYKNVYLKIVSDGTRLDFSSDVRNRILFEKWSLEKEIDTINSFDIGIMPLIPDKYSEGKCGFKLIQYMACELPVICSPVGVNSEIVRDGFNGFIAVSENDWVEKLSQLIENLELRKEIGRNARESIKDKYNIGTNATKLIKILKDFFS